MMDEVGLVCPIRSLGAKTGVADKEMMTLPEVADYLQLAERTVLRMAQRGELPAAKVASQWRFLRPLIREWVIAQMQGLPKAAADNVARGMGKLLPLSEVMRPDLMSFGIVPGPKETVLSQLVAPLVRAGVVRDPTRLLNGLIERERMMTTGIGHGVAMPHPREPLPGMFPEPMVAFGLCPEGADYQSIDDQLVHVFFLICATRTEVHLDLMAKVAWLIRQTDTLARLRQAGSADEVAGIVAEATSRIAEGPRG